MIKPSLVSIAIVLVLITLGCKQEKNGNLKSEDQMPEVNYDSLHSALADSNLKNGGANIFLEITNPDALFNSNAPSYIQAGNPNLQYISMQSAGKPGDDKSTDQDTTAKDFRSNIYLGKTVAWILKPKSRDQYKFHFQEIDFGEGKNPGNGNQSCNAFTVKRDKPKTEGPNKGAIVTQVDNDPSLEDCVQNYTLIFGVENNTGETRWFTLDPWVIIRN